MSVRELRALRESVNEAIKSAMVRERSELKAKLEGRKPIDLNEIDLERERDAWMARKR